MAQICHPVACPTFLHGLKNTLVVIPAKAVIQHKAREIELVFKIYCFYVYFFGFPPMRE